jgi:hypothetical protein
MRLPLTRGCHLRFLLWAGVSVMAVGGLAALAQAPGVPIIEQSQEAIRASDKAIMDKAETLRAAGKLLDVAAIKAQLAEPHPQYVALPKPSRKSLAPADVAVRARAAHLQLGWYYKCIHCNNWHVNLAAGYVLTSDGVAATCEHVVQPSAEMREGFFIAADEDGDVFAVTALLAKSQRLDAAVVRLEGSGFTPLALNDQVRPGDAAYCFSRPFGQAGYFSDGLINRFYWTRADHAKAANPLDAVRYLRMNVSTDWAPGSSGSAVLDACGNVIGHVSTISTMSGPPSQPTPQPKETPKVSPSDAPQETPKETPKAGGKTPAPVVRSAPQGPMIILHEAVPARGVMTLVRQMNDTVLGSKKASKKP